MRGTPTPGVRSAGKKAVTAGVVAAGGVKAAPPFTPAIPLQSLGPSQPTALHCSRTQTRRSETRDTCTTKKTPKALVPFHAAAAHPSLPPAPVHRPTFSGALRSPEVLLNTHAGGVLCRPQSSMQPLPRAGSTQTLKSARLGTAVSRSKPTSSQKGKQTERSPQPLASMRKAGR